MKLPHRRRFLQLAAGAAALPFAPHVAKAQAYPMRPVRLIVPFAPAGTSDIIARLVGQWLSEKLGQQFIVDNRTGGGGNIGTEAVVRATPDGYTLLVIDSSPTINATLYRKLNFNFIQDLEPIAAMVRVPNVMVVNPAFPTKTVPEFIAYAKANPGKITVASAGIGTPNHLAGELFKTMTGVEMTHVPYRGGGPAVADLLAGQVDVTFAVVTTAVEYIRTGKLRALAVTSSAPVAALADVPVMDGFVKGYEASGWHGMLAPKSIPPAVAKSLNDTVNAILNEPKTRERFADLGGMVVPGSPSDFARAIREDTEKWGRVIRAAKIEPM